MARDDRLTGFVGAALGAGRSRAEIRAALSDAGWSESEIGEALSAYAETAFTPPVPAPVPVVSARDFFLYALIFISLGVTAWHLVEAAHDLIDMAFGERAAPETPFQRSSLNFSVAMLAVFGPLYGYLSRQAERALRADPARQRSAVRRWTAALILLLTVLALLGTLASVVYGFLEGEADLVFVLKAAVAAAVAGAIFALYRQADG